MILAAVMVAALLAPAAGSSKKTQYLASKRDTPSRRPVAQASTVVYARNLHTREVMPLQPAAPAAHAEFFRCWFTHMQADQIPAELVDRVLAAAEHFDVARVHVISGYRHPKYNLMLRKKGRQVARKSHHTRGHAIDFSLPGVQTRQLYRWLLETHDGGVGFYRRSGFVHIDTGRKRTWRGT